MKKAVTTKKHFGDLMVDIETLGLDPTTVVPQIGACYFDRHTGKIGETFLVNICIKDSLNKGRSTTESTIKWWERQKDKITFWKDVVPLRNALTQLQKFVKPKTKIWAHATFDIPIIENMYRMMEMKSPWRYANTRDIRTLVDLSGINLKDYNWKNKTHDALDDCKHQVTYCVDAINAMSESSKSKIQTLEMQLLTARNELCPDIDDPTWESIIQLRRKMND